jgi:hypothetical protein
MARIANWVAVCETTCKKMTQSEPTHGNGDSGIDRPVPDDPFLPHSQLSAEDVSFFRAFPSRSWRLGCEFKVVNALVIDHG